MKYLSSYPLGSCCFRCSVVIAHGDGLEPFLGSLNQTRAVVRAEGFPSGALGSSLILVLRHTSAGIIIIPIGKLSSIGDFNRRGIQVVLEGPLLGNEWSTAWPLVDEFRRALVELSGAPDSSRGWDSRRRWE